MGIIRCRGALVVLNCRGVPAPGAGVGRHVQAEGGTSILGAAAATEPSAPGGVASSSGLGTWLKAAAPAGNHAQLAGPHEGQASKHFI